MALQYEGWEIDVAHNAAEAVDKYRANAPDVIVLDIMLPDMDGLGVLAQIRDSGTYTPTLFLTARDSLADRVNGLTAGGDDYMTKPFSLEELVARLRGLLRRSAYLTPTDDESLTVGDLTLDVASREVTRGGVVIALTSSEFELLRFLMRNPRRAMSREEILRRVWNYDFGGRSGIVDLYVSYLRKKIDATHEPMLHTVRGRGIHAAAAGMKQAWQRWTLLRQLIFGVSAVVMLVLVTVGTMSVVTLRSSVLGIIDSQLSGAADGLLGLSIAASIVEAHVSHDQSLQESLFCLCIQCKFAMRRRQMLIGNANICVIYE